MGNSLRCCLACVLPCGALDVVRIVHLNGLVEEFSCQIMAAQILKANPNHIITKPCTNSGTKRIGIVSPDSELKRGNIYFLIPNSSIPEKKKKNKEEKKKHPKPTAKVASSLDDDNYLRELLSDKQSNHRRRRSVRVAVWRPQLESILEE
jgi:PADRE domain